MYQERLQQRVYLGSGANLTSLPAAQLTGTLPAINGSNLTGISAGGMTLIHKAVVGSSSTVSQIIFQNLDYDSILQNFVGNENSNVQ